MVELKENKRLETFSFLGLNKLGFSGVCCIIGIHRSRLLLFSIIYLENAERKSTIDEISIDVTDGVHNTVKDDIKGKFYLLNCKDIKGGSLLLGNSERRETFAKLRKNKV